MQLTSGPSSGICIPEQFPEEASSIPFLRPKKCGMLHEQLSKSTIWGEEPMTASGGYFIGSEVT